MRATPVLGWADRTAGQVSLPSRSLPSRLLAALLRGRSRRTQQASRLVAASRRVAVAAAGQGDTLEPRLMLSGHDHGEDHGEEVFDGSVAEQIAATGVDHGVTHVGEWHAAELPDWDRIAQASPVPQAVTVPSGLTVEDVFDLSSRASARQTIYLDFDGQTTDDRGWSGQPFDTPAFDSNYSSDTPFTQTEIDQIYEIWARVAEDFSPFDVNVTTVEPTQAELSRTSPTDTEHGVRIVIGGNGNWLVPGIGGVAFVGSFNAELDRHAFSFSENFRGVGSQFAQFVAEVTSHEAGHTLGLRHDGRENAETGLDQEYYDGHGSNPSWSPIMGVGYYTDVVQFSRGEYEDADNNQDDLAVITGANNVRYREDDFPNTIEDAIEQDSDLETVDVTTPTGTVIRRDIVQDGVIEQNTDADVFRFTTQEGLVAIDVQPSMFGGNLDVRTRLYDEEGTLVFDANEQTSTDSYIEGRLTAGTYFLVIEGTGKEATETDQGYSDYASIGQYTIRGQLPPPDVDLNLTVIEGQILRDISGFWQPTEPLEGETELPEGPYGYGWRDDSRPIKVRITGPGGFSDETFIRGGDSTFLNDVSGEYRFVLPTAPAGGEATYELSIVELDGSGVETLPGYEPITVTVANGETAVAEDIYVRYDTEFSGLAWVDSNLDGVYQFGQEILRQGTFELDVKTAGPGEAFDGEIDGGELREYDYDIRVALRPFVIGGANYSVVGFDPGTFDFLVDPDGVDLVDEDGQSVRVFSRPTAELEGGDVDGVFRNVFIDAGTTENRNVDGTVGDLDAGYYYGTQFGGIVYSDVNGDDRYGLFVEELGEYVGPLDPGLGGRLIFLDLDGDGELDEDVEPWLETDFDDPTTFDGLGQFGDPGTGAVSEAGLFNFRTLPAALNGLAEDQLLPPGFYSVQVLTADGESLVGDGLEIFLTEGAGYGENEIAFRPVGLNTDELATTAISGYAYRDNNGDGLRPNGTVDPGWTELRVYVDLNGNRVFDADEPVTRTRFAGQTEGEANAVFNGFYTFDLPFMDERVATAEILVDSPIGVTTRDYEDYVEYRHDIDGSYAAIGFYGLDYTQPELVGVPDQVDVAEAYQFPLLPDARLSDAGDGVKYLTVRYYDADGNRLRDLSDGRVFAVNGDGVNFDGEINELTIDGRLVAETFLFDDELRFEFLEPIGADDFDRILQRFRYGADFGESYLRIDVWDDEIAASSRSHIFAYDSSESPLFFGAAAEPSLPTFVENGFSILAAPTLEVSDTGSFDFDGGALTLEITNYRGGDDFVFRPRPDANGIPSRVSYGSRGRVFVDGVQIGTKGERYLVGGQGGEPARLGVRFDLLEAATDDRITALLRSIGFKAYGAGGFGSSGDDVVGGVRNLRVSLDDGDGGIGAADTLIRVVAENDPTTLILGSTMATFVEGQVPVRLVDTVTLSDPDTIDYVGGTLAVRTLGGPLPNDRFSVRPVQGLLLTQDGTLVDIEEGEIIGRIVDDSTDSGELVVELLGGATRGGVDKLIRSIEFATLDDNPPETQTIEFDLRDADGGLSIGEDGRPATVDVTVVNLNDAPTIRYLRSEINFVEGGGRQLLSGGFMVEDIDYSGGGSLTFAYSGFTENDALVIAPNPLIVSSGDMDNVVSGDTLLYKGIEVGTVTVDGDDESGTWTVELTETANLFAARAIVRALAFNNTSGTPSEDPRFVEITFNDGEFDVSGTVQINVENIENAPVLQENEPVNSFLFDTDNPIRLFRGDEIVVSDADEIVGAGRLVFSVVEGRESFDRLRITADDSPATFNLRVGDAVMVDGRAIGTVTATGYSVRVQFNAGTTVSDVQTVIGRLAFHNIADDSVDQNGVRRFQVLLVDGAGLFDTAQHSYVVDRDAPLAPVAGAVADDEAMNLAAALLLEEDWLD